METLRKIIEENVRISQTPEAKSNDFRQNDIAYSQRQTKRRYSFLYVGPSSLFCIACSCKRC